MLKTTSSLASSFRDPSGYVFTKDGSIYRFIDASYKDIYETCVESGLFKELFQEHLLVSHTEVTLPDQKSAYKILKPVEIPFISYPYEWSFSQLKDAALTTLKIQWVALQHGMTLKDASAYNIQFMNGKPIHIDTLSFEKYTEGEPWVAYRQLCQHFLAPLALIAKVDLRFGRESRNYIDGIPLDYAAKLLPVSTKFSLGLGTHIHLHARAQNNHANDAQTQKKLQTRTGLSKHNFEALLHSLETTIQSLRIPQQKTEWGEYYSDTNYSAKSLTHKKELVEAWIEKTKPNLVWDAGANDATFSRLASTHSILTIASDIDPIAIEKAYKHNKDTHLLALVIDLVNPSPGIGWHNIERPSFFNRLHADTTLALALIHHLAIGNNLPFSHIAAFFAQQTNFLIIEFVPKEDSNAARLLATRKDIFSGYTEQGFEDAFKKHFTCKQKVYIHDSKRSLYLFERNS